MDNINDLKTQIAILESKTDFMEAELVHLNELLLKCGFPQGIKTLRDTVEEILSKDSGL